MKRTVDARGLNCPQPVILAKKALEENENIVVIVDNKAAMENVRRLGAKLGCSVEMENLGDGEFHIHLKRGDIDTAAIADVPVSCNASTGELVAVISSETMGSGNDDLGKVLMKAFIHTLVQADELPSRMLFYNTGVKLAAVDSEVLDDLKNLADAGVEILLCGTCLNFFNLSGSTGAGRITNMFEILSVMSNAARLIRP
ncbi:MAG TPA: sulfurtransferase-like selenium metabolism protein YedF [Desulfomonilia bacterium]